MILKLQQNSNFQKPKEKEIDSNCQEVHRIQANLTTLVCLTGQKWSVYLGDCVFQETNVQGFENSGVGTSCDGKHPKQVKHRIPQYSYSSPKKLSDLQQQTLQKV